MEDVVESAVETNEVPPAQETPAPVEAKTTDAPDEATPVAEVPAFTPNFKVKAYDKEFEIPEEFRALIKDGESEKKVREIFEKAYGLDGMKERYQKTKEDFGKTQEVLTQYAEQDKTIEFLSKCVEKKDFDTYFETLGIPEKDLQEWMLRKLQVGSLPPEQQALYNERREQQKRLYELEAKNSQYESERSLAQQNAEAQEAAKVEQDLNQTLAKPEVLAIAKQIDSRLGEGAFRNEVIKRGIAAYAVDKKVISAEEAVQQVLGLLGPGAANQSKMASVQAAKDKPVLPIVEGKPVSPTSKKPTSVSDLRKAYSELAESAE
jgi:hypothetical protein